MSLEPAIDPDAPEAAQHGDTYVLLTKVHHSTQADHKTATDPVALEQVIADELDSEVGTPEWRAWVRRAAARKAVC